MFLNIQIEEGSHIYAEDSEETDYFMEFGNHQPKEVTDFLEWLKENGNGQAVRK